MFIFTWNLENKQAWSRGKYLGRFKFQPNAEQDTGHVSDLVVEEAFRFYCETTFGQRVISRISAAEKYTKIMNLKLCSQCMPTFQLPQCTHSKCFSQTSALSFDQSVKILNLVYFRTSKTDETNLTKILIVVFANQTTCTFFHQLKPNTRTKNRIISRQSFQNQHLNQVRIWGKSICIDDKYNGTC